MKVLTELVSTSMRENQPISAFGTNLFLIFCTNPFLVKILFSEKTFSHLGLMFETTLAPCVSCFLVMLSLLELTTPTFNPFQLLFTTVSSAQLLIALASPF